MLSVEFQLFTREQCLHVLRQVVFGLLLKSAVPENTCSIASQKTFKFSLKTGLYLKPSLGVTTSL